jgi:hypothetical protein
MLTMATSSSSSLVTPLFHQEMVGLGLVMGSLTEAHFCFRFENDRHCSVFLILCFPTIQGTNNYSPARAESTTTC